MLAIKSCKVDKLDVPKVIKDFLNGFSQAPIRDTTVYSFTTFSVIVRQQTLHFLRRAALLQELLFHNVTPLVNPSSWNLPPFENQHVSSDPSHWTTDPVLKKHFQASTLVEVEMWERLVLHPPSLSKPPSIQNLLPLSFQVGKASARNNKACESYDEWHWCSL